MFIPGLMEESMMDSGKMVASMDRENTYLKQVNLEKECGLMVKEKNGWMTSTIKLIENKFKSKFQIVFKISISFT